MPNNKHRTTPQDASIQTRQDASSPACERLSDIYGPTHLDWEDYKTTEWLSKWIDENIGNDPDKRLDSTWGAWAFGDPTWSCADDGSNGCQMPDFCDNSRVNELSDGDFRMAYYVTLALHKLRSYFAGLIEALSTGAIYSAFLKETWYVYPGAPHLPRVLMHKSLSSFVQQPLVSVPGTRPDL